MNNRTDKYCWIVGLSIFLILGLSALLVHTIEIDFAKHNYKISQIKTIQKAYKSPIYSLESQSATTGSLNGFIVGLAPFAYGNTNGNTQTSINYYVYMKKGEGYILKNYPSDTTELIETDKEKPGLKELYKIIYIPESIEHWDLPTEYLDIISFDKFYDSTIKNGMREVWLLQNQSLIVPQNTIKKQFNASIQK